MKAAAKRLENIEQRWAALPGFESSIGLYLDDVLTAQQQLADSEYEFAKSETTYNLSLMNLKRATGTLLQHEHIQDGVANMNGLPIRILEKSTTEERAPEQRLLPSHEPTSTSDSSLSHIFAGNPISELRSTHQKQNTAVKHNLNSDSNTSRR